MMKNQSVVVFFVLLLCQVAQAYWACLHTCKEDSCKVESESGYPSDKGAFMHEQPWSRWLLLWSCEEECRYKCMWETVEYIVKNRDPVYQFHGKWPFIAILGMQEPASTVFSALHAVGTAVMLVKFKKNVPPNAPMYKVIYFYTLISINAWIWSTAFHARDTFFTEKMDYYSAISLILYSVFTLCARISYNFKVKRKWWTPMCFTMLVLFFCVHVYYLEMITFDYSYNMKVMVCTGIMNGVGWVIFCLKNLKTIPGVKKAMLSFVLVVTFISFETHDFPPIYWIFDAHSIWHGGTIPVPVLMLSFLIEDSIELNRISSQKRNQKSLLLQYMDESSQIVVHKPPEKLDTHHSYMNYINNNSHIHNRIKSS